MKEVGIVRKLDDLGRLVIPKEIRKMYKIKEGDSIEIFIENELICIRKYDETSSIMEQIEIICKILKENYENTVFFSSEEYLLKNKLEIDESFMEKLQVHRNMFFDSKKVYAKEEKRYSGYISPVVKDGIYYGSLVMVFEKKEYRDDYLETMRMFSYFLSTLQHG